MTDSFTQRKDPLLKPPCEKRAFFNKNSETNFFFGKFNVHEKIRHRPI